MSNFIYNSEDAQAYITLSLNIKQQLHSIARKYQSRLNTYAELVSKVVNRLGESRRDIISQDIVCNDYIVKSADLEQAINLASDTIAVTVADGITKIMPTEEVCNDLRTTIDESQIAISAIEALEYCQDANYSDVITIFNDKISSTVRNEESRYSVLANSMRQIILDRSSDIQQKLESILSVLTVNNSQDLPQSIDLSSLECSMSDYTFSTPAAALFGTIDIDWSNAWTVVRTAYQKSIALSFQVLIGFSKIIYAGYTKIKNWIQRNVTVGQWINVNDNFDDLSFDQGGLTSKYLLTDAEYALLQSKFQDKAGCVLKLYVPGGILFFLGIEDDETVSPVQHKLKLCFRPVISAVTLPERSNTNLPTLCYSIDGLNYDLTLSDIANVKNTVNGINTNRSATVPYDVNDLNLQNHVPYSGLLNAITLFYFFLRAIGYGYENEVGFSEVKASDLGFLSGGLSNKLSSFIPGYTDNKWDTTNVWTLTGDNTIYASLIAGRFLTLGNNSLGIIALIQILFNRSDAAEYGLSYEWVNTLGSPAYHLTTNTELAATFERALGTIAIIAAVVTLSIVAFKFTRSIKKKASIMQAQADRYYFSENFTGTDAEWNNWYKMQKKANLINLLAGSVATVISPSQEILGKALNAGKQYVVSEIIPDGKPLATSEGLTTATQGLAKSSDLNDIATKGDLIDAVADLSTKTDVSNEATSIKDLIR